LTGNFNITAALAATVERDCAPWDGAAFTISIPLDGLPGSSIDISIWDSPDFKIPVSFSFPGQTGRAGNAIYRPVSGPPEPLSGQVSFRHVDQANPIKGQFNLTSESGGQFSGRFQANWELKPIPCG